MSHFFAIVEPDPSIRDRVLADAAALFPEEGRRTSVRPGFGIAWWASANAPCTVAGDDGGFAMLLGDAYGPAGPVGAGELLAGPQSIPPWDGFHLGVRWKDGVATVCTDHLGLFPVYLSRGTGRAVAASSPKLLRKDPGFCDEVDPEGLAGILLTRGILGGKTLWKCAARLAPGAAGTSGRGGVWEERTRSEISVATVDPDHARLSFDDAVDVLGDVLVASTRRRRHPGDGFQLLSGGLDSRMVAGLLRETGGCGDALTFGGAFDVEFRVARRVARHLGYRHTRLPEPWGRYPQTARWIAEWEQLGAGFAFSFAPGIATPEAVSSVGARMHTGFLMDYVAGGTDIDERDHPLDAESVFAKCHNHNGLSPEVLERILRPGPVLEALQDIRADIVRRWEAQEGDAYQKAWLEGLPLRERHHVGINLWRMSFASWPSTNALDLAVLRTCLGLPAGAMLGRRAQKELVKRRYPDLAALPLDRNSFDTSPLLGGSSRLSRLAGRFRRRLQKFVGWESRYYFRAYDMDAPQWIAVRSTAEPFRRRLGDYFDLERLAEAVPPPGRPLAAMGDRIGQSGPLKLAVGLMLLADPAGENWGARAQSPRPVASERAEQVLDPEERSARR